jgi:hypothetical protein
LRPCVIARKSQWKFTGVTLKGSSQYVVVNSTDKLSISSLADIERYFEITLTLILSATNMKVHDTHLGRIKKTSATINR